MFRRWTLGALLVSPHARIFGDELDSHQSPCECALRISLTYDAPAATGKTSAHTDTYHGRFARLVPNEQVVEVLEFETTDPAMQGEMTITYMLADTDGGTDIHAVHDGLPPGVSNADNETGWRMSLDKLARLVESE